LEALKEKVKIFKYLSPKHPVWKDVSRTLVLLKEFNFEEDYEALLSKTLKYLRVKKMEHSALFAADSSVICLFPHNKIAHSVGKCIFDSLHVKVDQLNVQQLATPLSFDDSGDIDNETAEVKLDKNVTTTQKG
jgi:hypothetical protein